MQEIRRQRKLRSRLTRYADGTKKLDRRFRRAEWKAAGGNRLPWEPLPEYVRTAALVQEYLDSQKEKQKTLEKVLKENKWVQRFGKLF